MLVIQRPEIKEIGEEEANRQKFSIGPLERGFGHTLGNSLRRTLLSSIPGAAITEARIDGALHEFDTLPGVAEDVTDIILNLKDVVVASHSEEAVTVRLDVAGPAEVTAQDLQTNPEIEIMNPDLVIATLNDSARLACDLTVERGAGYRAATEHEGDSDIGVIPIDAIFSPIRRVSFTVDSVQVGQSSDYDQLTMDIHTDGSLSPRDALASAGATLRGIVQLVEEFSIDAPGLEIAESVVENPLAAEMNNPIEELDLSERPRNCLKRAQVNTIGELLEKSVDDLLAITNFGQKSLDEVIAKLDERGYPPLKNRS